MTGDWPGRSLHGGPGQAEWPLVEVKPRCHRLSESHCSPTPRPARGGVIAGGGALSRAGSFTVHLFGGSEAGDLGSFGRFRGGGGGPAFLGVPAREEREIFK